MEKLKGREGMRGISNEERWSCVHLRSTVKEGRPEYLYLWRSIKMKQVVFAKRESEVV